MVGAPRFHAALGRGESLGEGVEALEDELCGDVALILGEDLLAKLLLEVLPDDEDDLAKSRLDGVVYGVVHDGLTIGSKSVELLQPAVAATHSGSQKK